MIPNTLLRPDGTDAGVSTYFATEFIEIQQNIQYIGNFIANERHVYNENKENLGYLAITNMNGEYTFTITNANVKYIRFCVAYDVCPNMTDAFLYINGKDRDDITINIENLNNSKINSAYETANSVKNFIDNGGIITNNIYANELEIETGLYKLDGSFNEDQYFHSEFIDVTDYYALSINKRNDWCALFDENKNFLKNITAINADEIYNFNNDNAKYLVLSNTSKSSLLNLVVTLYKRSIFRQIVEYYEQDKKVQLSQIEGVSYFPNNLIEKCYDGHYITDVGLSASANNYFYTDFIPVIAGVKYKSNKGRNWGYYDESQHQLQDGGYVTGTGIQNGITIPEGAYYIRFTINKTADDIQYEEYKSKLYFSEFDKYSPTITIPNLQINVSQMWYSGKKINWIGDSIVDGPDFDEIVCNALGLIETDYGINGSTVAINEANPTQRTPLAGRYQEMTDDADIIAVSIGTNDFQYSFTDVGTIDDTTSYTFYGALKILCEGLLNKYPGKYIFFTTPIKRGQPFSGEEYTNQFSRNSKGKTLKEYCDIIKEVCSYYSIPVCDLYSESLLNPYLETQMGWFDSVLTHPNDTAIKMMARRVCGFLTQLSYVID